MRMTCGTCGQSSHFGELDNWADERCQNCCHHPEATPGTVKWLECAGCGYRTGDNEFCNPRHFNCCAAPSVRVMSRALPVRAEEG